MITHVLHSNVTVGPEDLESLVPKVVGSLTKDAKSFAQASYLYNSDFFLTEALETRTTLCTVLANFFGPEFQNSYWNKNRSVVS